MAVPLDTTAPYNEPVTGPVHAPRMPPRYFEFASPSDKNEKNRNGVSAQIIRELVRKYGNNILIGFDMGRIDPALAKYPGDPLKALAGTDFDQQIQAFKVAKQLGVRLHGYLGGPCGPTGSNISSDEYAFMRASAKRLGINVDNDGWMKQWNDWGWKETNKQQAQVLKRMGFESFELDNLVRDGKVAAAIKKDDIATDGGVPWGDGPAAKAAYIKLFQEVATWDSPSKLMLKNMSAGQLQAVEQAMKNGQLKRANFADFHISEENYQSKWPEIERASARMGIQLARAHNTHAYACSEAYKPGLEGALDQFLGGVANVVGSVVKGTASVFGIESVEQQRAKSHPASVSTAWRINAPPTAERTKDVPKSGWTVAKPHHESKPVA
jgi:hypothetical protein